MTEQNEQAFEAIAFVGDALAPFFLQDPKNGDASSAFTAMAQLEVAQAAQAWPFVEDAEAARCLQMMVDALSGSIDDAVGFSADEDLTWEYRRLFVGPGKKPCPPWGSVYTDHECVVFGESTLALRAWMRAHGVERTTDERTPEDHIGLLLGLMSWLAQNQPDDLDEFLRDHLFTWSTHYLDQLAKDSRNSFYEGLALLAKASLEGIQEYRGITVEYPHYYR